MNEALQFLTEYGLLVLFVVVFVEQIGLPMPAFPVLVAAGVLAATGRMNLWIALGGVVAVTLAADWIWFELGRRQGRRVLDVLCRIALEPDSCIRKTEEFFIKHGPHSLMAAKFIPGLSTVAPSLAGIVGLGVPLFLLYDGLGAVIWAGAGLEIGYVFSDQLEQAIAYVERVGPTATRAVLGALAFYILYKFVIRRRQLRDVPRVTVEQLMNKLQAEEPPLLVDVRSRASAVAEPGIPNAVLISLDELIRRQNELPRQRDVVLYCGCPNDVASAQGTLLLHKQGFTRVWPLAGGIDAWRKHSSVGAGPEPGASRAMAVGA